MIPLHHPSFSLFHIFRFQTRSRSSSTSSPSPPSLLKSYFHSFLILLIFLSPMLLTMLSLSHCYTLSIHDSLPNHHICRHVHSSSGYRYHTIIKVHFTVQGMWASYTRILDTDMHMNTIIPIFPTTNISPLIFDEAVTTISPGG